MKRVLILLCVSFGLCSCTSIYEDASNEYFEPVQTSNVKTIVSQMRSMHDNRTFRDLTTTPRRLPGPNITKQDAMKIAMADAKGAIKGGLTGGVWGAVGNAVISSTIKATKIYAWRTISGYFEDHVPLRIPSMANSSSAEDSVGYYHNLIEYTMYQQQHDLYTMPTLALYMKADSIMREISQEYAYSRHPLSLVVTTVSDVNSLRIIDDDESMTYLEYVDALIEAYPDEADYIEMIAQYIYDVNYANESLDDYTNEILWLIGTSDITEQEALVLKNAVLVAYSSILYNDNMTFIQSKQIASYEKVDNSILINSAEQ